MTYDALVLDHDGVLVDIINPETLRARFRRETVDEFETLGVEPTDEVVETLYLSVAHEDVQSLAQQYDVDPARLWRCREDAIERILREAAKQGEKDTYDDVRLLTAVDLPLGIVSNNQRRIVEFVTEYHGIRSYFDTIRAREPRLDSLRRKKPSPTLLREALADLCVENPLYVGDTESDVLAAQRAGVDVAFLRRRHNGECELETEPSIEVTGLADVIELLDTPPRSDV